MLKSEYKARYRALRIKLNKDPGYIPTTEVEYDLYMIWVKSRNYLPSINQMFTGYYGKAILEPVSEKNVLIEAIVKAQKTN